MAKAKSNKKIDKSEKVEKIESTIDPQKAAEAIEQEKKERVTQCGKEVVMVLKKYNCDFDITMLLRQGSITPNIQIVAK